MARVVRSVVFMVLLSAVCTAVPAWLKASTEDLVRGHELLKTRRNVLTAMNLLPAGATPFEINDIFQREVTAEEKHGRIYWTSRQKTGNAIVAFAVSGPGFWGPIEGVVAVNPENYRIIGVTFTKHSETPGLGGRIDEEWFQKQFDGLKLDPESRDPLVRLVAPGTGTRPTDVDAITGATETSRKIQQLFDRDARAALEVLNGEHI